MGYKGLNYKSNVAYSQATRTETQEKKSATNLELVCHSSKIYYSCSNIKRYSLRSYLIDFD
jgi:hypothetical protein